MTRRRPANKFRRRERRPRAEIPAGRLAMRIEGEYWIAYFAELDTMEQAIVLGSIKLSLITNNPDRKQAFVDLMQGCLNDAIEAATGHAPSRWGAVRDAPEHERSKE